MCVLGGGGGGAGIIIPNAVLSPPRVLHSGGQQYKPLWCFTNCYGQSLTNTKTLLFIINAYNKKLPFQSLKFTGKRHLNSQGKGTQIHRETALKFTGKRHLNSQGKGTQSHMEKALKFTGKRHLNSQGKGTQSHMEKALKFTGKKHSNSQGKGT